MKKWFKKHIAVEWYTGYSGSFAFAEIYLENGFEGYTFQFVLFDKGFSITYHTKKALRWLREIERDLKKTNWEKVLSNQKEFDKFTTVSSKKPKNR